MAARQIILGNPQPSRDANGRSLAGYLYFYSPNTSTPKTVYADMALSTALEFPVASDSAGRFVPIWAEEDEKFDVLWTDRDGVTQGTFPDVGPLSDALLASAEASQDAADRSEAAEDAAVIAAAAADTSADAAAVSAAAAEAAYDDLSGLVVNAGFYATSSTSTLIGSGSKSQTVELDKAFQVGQFITVASRAAPNTNFMAGQVTSYNAATGALVFLVPATGVFGAGTYADWTIALSGSPGASTTAFASTAEVVAGTETAKAISPATLAESQAPVAATVSGTISPDCTNSKIFKWLLGGNITLNNPSASIEGASVIYRIKQPSSGGPYTITLGAGVLKGADIVLTLSTAANKVDAIATIIIDGVTEIVGFTKDIG